VPDYSEFPTTPTAWQEIHQLELEDPPPPPRPRVPDLTALIPGVVFSLLAILFMTGLDVPLGIFRDGGVLWLFLIGGGALLLMSELRKVRRRR
jgi:hypothetical protein